ncbi:primosomal protein N' [Fibrobacter sp. UWEL]|uniref:replication restart helicase PriA n=1 Tax=Fibrobacter sp. UWEL TaxID=1896209 RepID=UPI00091E4064|nr:primosomal protein N' [Fibrobacter sp. UWEL]SHK57170.1 replication restart DNA helicase PriA [Fibrobacter sp. UWEL]
MAKRIPKIIPPEEIKTKVKSASLTQFCEVYVPMAPAVYTYGVPQGVTLCRGNLVWVQFATRKKPALAVVSKVHGNRPSFDVRLAVPHQSGFSFSERYMENLEWTASYYISTPMKALFVFWPADFEKFLEAYAARSPSNAEGPQNVAGLPQVAAGVSLDVAGCGLPPKPSDLPPLTLEQKNALDSLVADLDGSGFRGTLLHGVTGSGKTRVYQELAYEALSRGKKVLILVPEIGLTPQTASRFESFLQVPVVVLHSALSTPKKRAGYVSIMDGSARVVLGTRSAILAPFDFDLVIIDEEHDSSFKQQDPAPRYHTRDLAFHLAYKHGALVVLGSATPSLETYHNVSAGHLKVLRLKERATQAPMPQVSILDMCKMRQQKGIMLSPQLREALTDCVAGEGQAIVLMNRRGYSKIRVCSECGETLYCKDCHVPLVYHKQYSSLMCHYCGRLYPVNSPCHSCGAETYEFVGGAIEMLEDEIQEWVPGAKVVRMDRDTTQNVGASEKILDSFRNREYNILIGTQMVAKGHDFPGVRLVGVVGADSGLGIPDFRSSEKMYQLLSQTAGRAGRAGDVPGQVFIQTLKPTEPVMQFAVHHDFDGFAAKEVQDRQDAFYPPFCKLVEISCGSRDEGALTTAVNQLEQILRAEKSLLVLGPVDAFISMVQNIHWAKLYVKTKDLALVRRILSPIVNSPKPWAPGVDIKVEID